MSCFFSFEGEIFEKEEEGAENEAGCACGMDRTARCAGVFPYASAAARRLEIPHNRT
jgi:hypothetical protein